MNRNALEVTYHLSVNIPEYLAGREGAQSLAEVSDLTRLLHVFLQECQHLGARLDIVYSDGTLSLSGTDERLGTEQGFTRIAAARHKQGEQVLAGDEYDLKTGRWFSVIGKRAPTLEDILAGPDKGRARPRASGPADRKVVSIRRK